MTRPEHEDVNGSTRLGHDSAGGTTTGADVSSRMAGTDREHVEPRHAGRVETDTDRYEERVVPARVKNAKTSAAAAFGLVFGLAALFCALTGILAPFAVLFGVIGVVLAIVGLKKARLPGVTGKGVAIGGLITALLGLLLGAAVLAGAAVYVNEQGLDRLEQRFDNARDSIPSGSEVRDSVENTTN